MEIGMLWYDNGSSKLKERVQRAAEYYTGKYGRKPNLCLVNPDMLKGEASKVNGVQVRTAQAVRPDHFWIGVDEAAAKNGTRTGKSKSKSKSTNSKSKAGSKAAEQSGKGAKAGQTGRVPAEPGDKKKAD